MILYHAVQMVKENLGSDNLAIVGEWLREYRSEKSAQPSAVNWGTRLYWFTFLMMVLIMCWYCWILISAPSSYSVLEDMQRFQVPVGCGSSVPISKVRRANYGHESVVDAGDEYSPASSPGS